MLHAQREGREMNSQFEANIVREELKRIVGQIWDMTLQLGIVENLHPGALDETEGQQLVHIDISGAWCGRLELLFSKPLAKKVTQRMFALEQAEPKDDQLIDAIKEIANIAGGNLKCFLPEPCDLSLPAASLDSQKFVIPEDANLALSFRSDGEEFRLFLQKFQG